ncbi:MAG: hypothetical protein M1834_006143 [Cirrosporium novae-zelandiae]|nr:MAG: hypothetical protein M1834_006143 [Cirrosporium novae-zelandiae]
MASNRSRRIAKELADIQADSTSKVFAAPINDEDLTHLKGSFLGPPGTPYEGGTYKVDIKIPNEYPFRPPVMRFDNQVWHPNVSSVTGMICLDTLSTQWSPVLTIKSALLSLQSLLSTPEPKDPQDAVVAKMMINEPEEFNRMARDWAVRYAGAPKKDEGGGSGGPTTEKFPIPSEVEQDSTVHMAAYDGYNRELIDRFVSMGFDIERVVEAFNFFGIDRMNGREFFPSFIALPKHISLIILPEDYELEEAYIGDITARLFGEA